MKKRNEKIKEIENLIEKNRCSRRKFIDSLGKTVALSSVVALGISSFLSCKKMDFDEELDKEIETTDSINKSPKGICLEGDSCKGGYEFHLGGSGA